MVAIAYILPPLSTTSDLRIVQMIGWQDPFVRVWTSCTLRSDWKNYETNPSMNTHRTGCWLHHTGDGAEVGERLVLSVGINRPRLSNQRLLVQVRNFNGAVLPSDTIGTGCE